MTEFVDKMGKWHSNQAKFIIDLLLYFNSLIRIKFIYNRSDARMIFKI